VYISVIGAANSDQETARLAEEVGKLIAEKGAVLVCGGLGGVMTAVSKGAREAGGVTVGILPGTNRTEANPHLTIALATGLGYARNALVVQAGDAVIAVGGEFGTLSEIGFALQFGKPVIGLNTWELNRKGLKDSIVAVKSPKEAVEKAFQLAGATPARSPKG